MGDFDGDGKLDIAVSASFVSGAPPRPGFTSGILQNPASPGAFLAGVHYAIGSDPFSLAAGDLNGNGRLDLVAASTTLNVAGNTPARTRGLHRGGKFPGISEPLSVAIGDLNGNGVPDIAVAGDGAAVLFNNPAMPGRFLPSVRMGY